MFATDGRPEHTPRPSGVHLGRVPLLLAAALGAGVLVLLATARSSPATAAGFPACNRVDPHDAALVAEGQQLFNSPTAFHQTGSTPSCALCHLPTNFYTDNLNHQPTPKGGGTPPPPRSTPSLNLTLRGTPPYHWDGKFPCLQRQAYSAITGTVEMGGTVSQDATGQHQMDAIAAFELSIPLPPRLTNLDPARVQRGQALFQASCAGCHPGPLLTDNGFHNIGLNDGDPGAGGGEFNTPTLRRVYVSAPYFHNGRNGIPEGSPTPVATEPRAALHQVVDFFNTQDGLGLTDSQQDDLVEYLLSL